MKTFLQEAFQDAWKIFVRNERMRICKKWMPERWGFQQVIDLGDWDFPSNELSRQVTVCSNHDGKYKVTCSLHNMKLMKSFYFSDVYMEWECISEITSFL